MTCRWIPNLASHRQKAEVYDVDRAFYGTACCLQVWGLLVLREAVKVGRRCRYHRQRHAHARACENRHDGKAGVIGSHPRLDLLERYRLIAHQSLSRDFCQLTHHEIPSHWRSRLHWISSRASFVGAEDGTDSLARQLDASTVVAR